MIEGCRMKNCTYRNTGKRIRKGRYLIVKLRATFSQQ